MSEPKWERIGLRYQFCVDCARGKREGIKRWGVELPLDSPKTGIAAREGALTDRMTLAVFKHLDVSLPHDDNLADWEGLARELPALALHYFNGAWRDGFVEWEQRETAVDPAMPWIKSGRLSVAECRAQLEWIDELRYGLFWALFFDDERNLAQLAAWPDIDLREDEGLDDLTKADCDYYVLLCKWLGGEPFDPDGPLTNSIRLGTKKRPKLLLMTLDAIVRGDGAAYGKAMLDHLKNYQKSGFHTRSIRRCVSIDGSILWQLARRRGLPQPTLPEALEHLVLTHATLSVGGP